MINEAKTNAVGNPVSYEIVAANHATLMLDRGDWPARRARFLEHDVWVTPHAPAERYAAGEYMVGSTGDDGLPAWTARNRAIRNQDIVVWVNLGMHHLTRAEDLPVMPTLWHSPRLRPFNFFDRKPGDRPPEGATRTRADALKPALGGLELEPGRLELRPHPGRGASDRWNANGPDFIGGFASGRTWHRRCSIGARDRPMGGRKQNRTTDT